MKRSDITYAQLDKVLRSLGFSCRRAKDDPPARVYENKATEWIIILPAYPKSQRAFEHHVAYVRTQLEHTGLADPSDFDAELQKAG